MARIAGINLPAHKHVEIALTSVYGIGRVTAQRICDQAGIGRNTKVHDLSEDDADRLRSQVAAIPVEVGETPRPRAVIVLDPTFSVSGRPALPAQEEQ